MVAMAPSAGRRVGASFVAIALTGFLSVPVAGLTVAQPWHVEGRSMEPAIQDGSTLLVDIVLPHVTGYGRGDVVVLATPVARYAYPVLVKRIVAVAGDHVQIHDGGIWINGTRSFEPYLGAQEVAAIPAVSVDVVVPAGSVFVLGDHRANSYDSKAFGPVPVATLMGRAWMALAPGGRVELPGTAAGPAGAPQVPPAPPSTTP